MKGEIKAKVLRGTAYVPDAIKGEKGEAGVPDYNLVSNALKGKEEGTYVTLEGVSPLEHDIKVKLKRTDAVAPYYKYDFNADGVVNNDDATYLLYHANNPDSAEFAIPWWTNGDVDGNGVVDMDDSIALGEMIANGDTSAFDVANVFEGVILTKRGKDENGVDVVEQYAPSGDGTVRGVTSLYPTTNLTTDAENIIIEAEYNKDTEKAIEEASSENQKTANALKGTASGSAVVMTDVSPLEHNICVRLSANQEMKLLCDSNDLDDFNFLSGEGEYVVSSLSANAYGAIEVYFVDGSYIFYSDSKGMHTMFGKDDALYWNESALELFLPSKGVDFSSVTLTKYGKNLLPYPYYNTSNEKNGVKWIDNGDGTITGVGTPTSAYTAGFVLSKDESLLKAGFTYTLSVGSNFDCYIQYDDENGAEFYVRTVAWKDGYHLDGIYIQAPKIQEYNGTAYPQLEIGATATEYEHYKEPETYNGTVESVTSLYPTTTLLTDTAGVTIEAEYNRDINKAFAELLAKIGG